MGFHDLRECAVPRPVDRCLPPDPTRFAIEGTLLVQVNTIEVIIRPAEGLSAETSHFRVGEAAEQSACAGSKKKLLVLDT